MARGISRQLVISTFSKRSHSRRRKTKRRRWSAASEESLRTNLTYLASDELAEGRATPSKGLDKAADYIAEQFKKAKLQPVNGSYFQSASLADIGPRGAQIERTLAPDAPRSMRNVVGLIKGSDRKLRDTYIIVSSHYDHVGLAATGEDRIFNGANDDGSGTVSVIESRASAFKSEAQTEYSVHHLLRRGARPPWIALLRAASAGADRADHRSVEP